MLLDDLIARYGATDGALRPIRPGQGGASVWEVSLDGTRRALRVSGPFLSAQPGWIEFEGALLAQARNAGVSVAAALPGLDGRYGQEVDGGVALLTEWADGDVEWPTPPGKARTLGRAVAELHAAIEGLSPAESFREFGTAGLLDRPMALLNEVTDASPLAPFVEEMRERIGAIPLTSVSFGPIHGDVHQGNCHFEGERATLFDFAQCGVGWRAFDLAGFLWPWRDASIERPELRAACDAYLDGYRSTRALTLEEERALPAFVRARDLWEAGEWVAVGDARQKPDEIRAGILAWAEAWAARPLSESLP